MTASTPEQRRILVVLVAAQVLSGAGLAAGITVGALLAQELSGSTGLAGVPTALFTIGSAAAAVGVGRLSQARGRRPGLTLGYVVGAVGAMGVVVTAVTANVVLLFVALLVYGAGTSTNLQARYAGADLAPPGGRARAVSIVLVATTLGGVVGPNLTAATGSLAEALGIRPLAGPFLLAAAAYALAALVLGVFLRPDPLQRARELDESPVVANAGPARPVDGSVLPGAAVMIVTQLVMVAIMTMTPVHILEHGHGVGAAGAVIALHVAAMFLPSPVTGWLVDRVGRVPVAAASGGTLLAAGVLGAVAPDDSTALLAVALVLLGLGWNLGLVSGTAMITDAVPLARRARTQGTVDVGIALSGAGAGLASGLVVAGSGYAELSLGGGIVALVMLPFLAAGRRRRIPSDRHA
ncbi:MFS transporter [Pseudonocardia endophytica]|uniref:MFS transporter n=1 Tax=Pseudonocardia endophytica TaxID=401976 RepID=UPI001043D7AF|nr:MFS transporter [Pseudonocardia endophytica]